MPKKLPTKEELETKYSYNSKTGEIRHLSGKIAGYVRSTGYRTISFRGNQYQAHRLAFIFMGTPLVEEVDHIDKNKDNNSWGNLRQVDRSLNCHNRGNFINNSIGFKGVQRCKVSGKYRARIRVNNKSHYSKLCDSGLSAHNEYLKLKNLFVEKDNRI